MGKRVSRHQDERVRIEAEAARIGRFLLSYDPLTAGEQTRLFRRLGKATDYLRKADSHLTAVKPLVERLPESIQVALGNYWTTIDKIIADLSTLPGEATLGRPRDNPAIFARTLLRFVESRFQRQLTARELKEAAVAAGIECHPELPSTDEKWMRIHLRNSRRERPA